MTPPTIPIARPNPKPTMPLLNDRPVRCWCCEVLTSKGSALAATFLTPAGAGSNKIAIRFTVYICATCRHRRCNYTRAEGCRVGC